MTITALNSPSLSSALGSSTLSESTVLENALYAKQLEFVNLKVEMDALYADRENTINQKTDQWISVLGDVGVAATKAEGAVEEADNISTALLEMRASVEGASKEPDSVTFKEDFNERVRRINVAASTYGSYDNLIGGVDRITRETNTLAYVDDLGATETKLYGTDLSADFMIKADDGTVWMPDLGTATLEQYEGITNNVIGAKADKSTSTNTGLTLVSYDETTGDITVSARIDGADQTISGKLERYGNKMMSSWFYDDFKTQEGTDRAYKDISNAENIVAVGKAQSTMNLSIAKSSEDKIRRQTDILKEERTENSKEQTEAGLKMKQDYELQYNGMSKNLEAMKSQQASYLNIFSGALNSNSNSIVNILS